MTAWLLLALNLHSVPMITGIASEKECRRIGDMLAKKQIIVSDYQCISYEMASERGSLQFRRTK